MTPDEKFIPTSDPRFDYRKPVHKPVKKPVHKPVKNFRSLDASTVEAEKIEL
jgi:hypothetical protein